MSLSSAVYNSSSWIVRNILKIITGKDEMLGSSVPPLFAYMWSEFKLLMSHKDEDYQDLYGFVDYKDKVVLDIGADYGSTALFFLEKGAKTVYAVERNKWMIKKMKRIANRINNIVPMKINVACSMRFEHLLELNPDIVKVDCEGCEEYLLGVDNLSFLKANEYIIETHTKKLFVEFTEKLEKLNYTISNVRCLHKSNGENDIMLFYAKRNDKIYK